VKLTIDIIDDKILVVEHGTRTLNPSAPGFTPPSFKLVCTAPNGNMLEVRYPADSGKPVAKITVKETS